MSNQETLILSEGDLLCKNGCRFVCSGKVLAERCSLAKLLELREKLGNCADPEPVIDVIDKRLERQAELKNIAPEK